MSGSENRVDRTENRIEEHLPRTDMRMDMPLGQNITAIIPPSQMKTPGSGDDPDPYGESKLPSLENAMGMPHVGKVYISEAPLEERTSASDTLTGATSADVHYGHGRPVQGESSAEMHHDGQAHRKRQGGGVEQHGVQSGALDNVNREDEVQDIKEARH
ncbi:hypothetical protein PENSPDRAFT_760301 [Peniophora sp. CONT]|nr:hypothetical protein PENSPDRAFT_760301 [Peniophora sp. CONT]